MRTICTAITWILCAAGIVVIGQQAPLRGLSRSIGYEFLPEQQPSPNLPPVPKPNFPFERERQVDIHADKSTITGDVVLYRGNVVMTTECLILSADELDYRPSEKIAEVRGSVRVQVRPAAPLVMPLER